MSDIVYEFLDGLYINLTNRCSNACDFCLRNDGDGVGGSVLWLKKEPIAQEVIDALIPLLPKYKEVIFCGYGEPTERLNVLLEVAAFLKKEGKRVRLNTNGQSDLINKGANTAKELLGRVDIVSVSLNHVSAKKYQELCHSVYGEEAFYAVIKFARECAALGIETVMSVVDVLNQEEIEECRRISEESGVKFRVREKY